MLYIKIMNEQNKKPSPDFHIARRLNINRRWWKIWLDLTSILPWFLQISTLREEVESKQAMMEELRDSNQKLTLAQEKMIADYEKLKREEEEKSAKLADITVANERKEQAKQDLKGK